MYVLSCKTLSLILRWDTGKVRDRLVVWVGLRVGQQCNDTCNYRN